jgi:hypothetical protein
MYRFRVLVLSGLATSSYVQYSKVTGVRRSPGVQSSWWSTLQRRCGRPRRRIVLHNLHNLHATIDWVVALLLRHRAASCPLRSAYITNREPMAAGTPHDLPKYKSRRGRYVQAGFTEGTRCDGVVSLWSSRVRPTYSGTRTPYCTVLEYRTHSYRTGTRSQPAQPSHLALSQNNTTAIPPGWILDQELRTRLLHDRWWEERETPDP